MKAYVIFREVVDQRDSLQDDYEEFDIHVRGSSSLGVVDIAQMDSADKGLMPLLEAGTVELVTCESDAMDCAMLEAGGIVSVEVGFEAFPHEASFKSDDSGPATFLFNV